MTGFLNEPGTLPLVERLGWTLIHFVWQGTIVAVIVAAALRVFRKASAKTRYAGLCAALLAVAAAPVVTFFWIPVESPASSLDAVSPRGDFFPVVDGVDVAANDAADGVEPGAGGAGQGANRVNSGTARAEIRGTEGRLRFADGEAGAATLALRLKINAATPWVVGVWIAGVGVFSVWHMAGWWLARRLTIRGTRPVVGAVQEMFERLMRRMEIRGAVRLLESTATSVPIVVGWLKPVVLLPASVLVGLPMDQVEAILAHELAHVRRHDFLVNLLQSVVETCLFYHPAVWWLSRQIRTEREYCADEEAAAACADRGAYARALVSLVEVVGAVPSMAVAATGGALTRRIHRVLGLTSDRDRSTRHPAWLLSAGLGAIVVWGLVASTRSEAQPQDKPAAIAPIKEVAEKLKATSKHWTLQEQDEQPSVAVEGYRGFRVVLRRTWKEFPIEQVQRAQVGKPEGPFELRHEDWEFVLIPVRPKEAPATLKEKIPWRKSTSPYHTRDLCLGQGFGYVWFTRGTLFGQEFVRDTLKLEGGDDRIQLAMDGLQVQDEGTNTANSCVYVPAKFGDRALPYVERAIEEATAGEELWRVVGCLGHIQTDRSTELLLKLFESKNNELRRAAQYGLIQKPYRKAAKRAYLDMLKRQSSLESAARACVEFEWKEAVPILREVIAGPEHLISLQHAIPACRTLEGRPIAQELLDAKQTLHSLFQRDRDAALERKIAAARRLLIESGDAEGANLAALLLATMKSKGGAVEVNKAGLEILKSRPRQTTVAFLKPIIATLEGNEQREVEALLDAVVDGAEQADP